MAGGEVTTVEALETTTVGEFKRRIVEALRKDDDDLTKGVTVVDLLWGEQPLLEDSATIAESGLSNDKAVMALFKQRSVECVRWQDCPVNLDVADRPILLMIPDGTAEIPSEAFKGCSSIQSVRIPGSVTRIGEEAFHGCSSLTSLTIPDSVTSIGDSALEACSSLAALTIPDSVTSIECQAFRDCSALTGLIIPHSVTTIEAATFAGCSSLGSLTIPDSVSSIGVYAFCDCTSLTHLTIPKSVAIGDGAFMGCSWLCGSSGSS